jgi:hypothetical protein
MGLLPGRPAESLLSRLRRDRHDPTGRTSRIHRNPRTTVAGPAPLAAGVSDDGPSACALASPRLPAQHTPADRAARLQRDRLRDIVSGRDDQDFHVILRSGPYHMISEAPNAPSCTPNATSYRKTQMRVARSRVRRSCARARVTGVAFFDFFHGQRGAPRTRSSFSRSSPTPASRRHCATAATTATRRAMRSFLPHRLHPAERQHDGRFEHECCEAEEPHDPGWRRGRTCLPRSSRTTRRKGYAIRTTSLPWTWPSPIVSSASATSDSG